MPREPRKHTLVANHSVHKIWRGHNREWNLGSHQDKTLYLKFLNQDIEGEKFCEASQLHALTLMDNHAHEIVHVRDVSQFSAHMRRHHSKYGANFNKRKNRCGKVAQDRPKTVLIEDDYHSMMSVFYVHANPLRANIVKDCRDYLWSTHRLYAFNKREPWMKNIQLPRWYIGLGKTSSQRQKAYRRLFAQYLRRYGLAHQPEVVGRFYGSLLWQQERRDWIHKNRLKLKPP